MNSLIVILIDILVIVICASIIKKMTGSFSIFNINGFTIILILNFFIFAILGSSLFLLGFGKNYYGYEYCDNPATQLLVWITIVYSTLIFFTTIYYLNKKSNIIGKAIFSIKDKCLIDNDNYLIFWIRILTVYILFFYIFYSVSLGYIPFIKLFTASASELNLLRYNDKFGVNFGGILNILKNISLYVLPFIVSYAAYIAMRNSKRWTWLFIFTVIIALLCLTARYEKGLLIYYLFGFVMLPNKGKKNSSGKLSFNYKKIPLIAVLTFIIAIFYIPFVMTRELNGFNSVMNRMIYSPISGLYLHYEYFPDEISFLNFKNYPTLISTIFNTVEIRSSKLVMNLTTSSSTAGFFSTFFTGEAYANGGWVSVVLSPIIVALSVFIQIALIQTQKDSPFKRACLVYLLINFPFNGGYLDFFYNATFIIVFVLLIATNKIAMFRKKTV